MRFESTVQEAQSHDTKAFPALNRAKQKNRIGPSNSDVAITVPISGTPDHAEAKLSDDRQSVGFDRTMLSKMSNFFGEDRNADEARRG